MVTFVLIKRDRDVKLEKSRLKKSKIFFGKFIFNPLLRTLQSDENTQQLRKKQSDVLALLCNKYPDPVSLDEFLIEVWGGSYVTPQSVAQVIRSLRLSLNDESKTIIVNIPKLGYRLTVEPYWERSDCPLNASAQQIKTSLNVGQGFAVIKPHSLDDYLLTKPSMRQFVLNSSVTQSENKKNASKKWVFSTALVFCFSLICFVISTKGYATEFSKKNRWVNSDFFHDSQRLNCLEDKNIKINNDRSA